MSRLVLVPLAMGALIVLRSGQPEWFALSLLALAAFESNRHRIGRVFRLLAVLVQVAAVAGFAFLGWAIANFAESGDQALLLRGVAVVVVAVVVLLLASVTFAAIRTLQDESAV